jgi:3-oxoacyl-[acyl-carrier protein] reductase
MSNTHHLALVTGAAGTMGRAVVEAFVKEGVRVAAVDIDPERLAAMIESVGGEVSGHSFDISDPAAVSSGVSAIAAEHGPVDILVNNAGILSNNKAMETTPEEWNRVMAINLSGAFYLSQQVLPAMRAGKWGRIINTSSYAAKSGGVTAGTAYSVSKAAMIGLTFSLAAETTRDGITVNGIAPAYVRTPMVTEQLSAEKRAEIEAKIPVGRFCEPEEFAHVVMFLASEKSGFITGEIVDLNGGFHFD